MSARHAHRSQRSGWSTPATREQPIRCPVCGTQTRNPTRHKAYEPGTTRWSWCAGPDDENQESS